MNQFSTERRSNRQTAKRSRSVWTEPSGLYLLHVTPLHTHTQIPLHSTHAQHPRGRVGNVVAPTVSPGMIITKTDFVEGFLM